MAVILKRLYDGKKHCFSKISMSEKLSIRKDLYAPFPNSKYKDVGNYNGVLCLDYDDAGDRDIYFWSPCTGELESIPPPPRLKPPLCCHPNCKPPLSPYPNSANINMDGSCTVHVISRVNGLGFDPESRDYKAVRLVDYVYDHREEDCDLAYSKQVEVYSLENDCWRGIDLDEEIEKFDIIDELPICVKGVCYWKAKIIACSGVIIVSFNLAEEKFSIQSVPYPCPDRTFALIELQEMLGVVIYRNAQICKDLYPWVLRVIDGQQQWCTAGFRALVEADRPLGYCRNGEVLLLQGYDGKLLVYDSLTRKVEKIDQIYDYPHSMQLFPYVEGWLKRKGKPKRVVDEKEEMSERKGKSKRERGRY